MLANDLGWLDAVALRDLVADGEITPAELADSAIARIDAANPMLNAVVVPLPDIGRALAADPALPRGPFHGVPFLLKDVGACLAGLPLYMGNGLLRSLDWRAPADTILGTRFRAAGVVTIGKTALPEFGCQPTTQPITFGACRNPGTPRVPPRDPAAVRPPPSRPGWCRWPTPATSAARSGCRPRGAGSAGLKPSRGRTSSLPITDPNLVEHVITRSVRDTAAFLDAVGGADADRHLPPAGTGCALRGNDVGGTRRPAHRLRRLGGGDRGDGRPCSALPRSPRRPGCSRRSATTSSRADRRGCLTRSSPPTTCDRPAGSSSTCWMGLRPRSGGP